MRKSIKAKRERERVGEGDNDNDDRRIHRRAKICERRVNGREVVGTASPSESARNCRNCRE